ncbi:hypothetical protein IHN63_01910 [Deinococcus sp. 6YEL10]|uniref:hypothetical protein n=1 Tax=Deinococcus sp. 6YEL10 TaxID=2745870 RepID=UPI001E58D225|nr:hypothetical protein [Deinococcus sp. 6YEL10]MCD0160054.1 hypothetical protein [Deinococcus sp. 6YEL10]
MNNQIMLAQATPPGGIILRVRNLPGGLVGAVIEGVDGPNVVLEFSDNGVNGWNAFPPPLSLSTETYMRLTRTDTSSAISTIRLTAPVGVTGSLDGDGHLVIEGLTPVATGAALDTLEGRVTTLEGGSGGGGGTAGPIALSVGPGAETAPISGSPTSRQVREVRINAQSACRPQLIDRIYLYANVPAANVTGIYISDANDNPLFDGGPASVDPWNGLFTAISLPAPVRYGRTGDSISINFDADVAMDTFPVTQTTAQIATTARSGTGTSYSGMLPVSLVPVLTAALDGPLGHHTLPIVQTATVNPPVVGGYWEVVDNGGGAPRIRYSDGYNWYSTLLTAE